MTDGMPEGRPLCIGLFGGIAAGKSTVSDLLRKKGAALLDADKVAHTCLGEPDVRALLIAEFGEGILDADGTISRPALAEVAFATPEAAKRLNAIVHPAVTERMEAGIAAHHAAGVQVVILDGALLIEAGWGDRCDLRLFVDAPEAVREQRAQERGWEPGERAKRESRQVSVEAKRAAADAVIRNGFDWATAATDVDAFWAEHVAPRLAS
ncbi:MAG: dephospho-CoA kinase [Planctomycetota bacterium]|jgi:dephospho-CoA kinase